MSYATIEGLEVRIDPGHGRQQVRVTIDPTSEIIADLRRIASVLEAVLAAKTSGEPVPVTPIRRKST